MHVRQRKKIPSLRRLIDRGEPDVANKNKMVESRPTVLIIGGLGYIGSFLALYVHQNQLASDVLLVDAKRPDLSWLGPEFDEAGSATRFLQVDASVPG